MTGAESTAFIRMLLTEAGPAKRGLLAAGTPATAG